MKHDEAQDESRADQMRRENEAFRLRMQEYIDFHKGNLLGLNLMLNLLEGMQKR